MLFTHSLIRVNKKIAVVGGRGQGPGARAARASMQHTHNAHRRPEDGPGSTYGHSMAGWTARIGAESPPQIDQRIAILQAKATKP